MHNRSHAPGRKLGQPLTSGRGDAVITSLLGNRLEALAV